MWRDTVLGWCDTLQLLVDVTRYNFGLMWRDTILGWCDTLQLLVDVTRYNFWLMWHDTTLGWCDTLQLRVDVTRYNFGLMWRDTTSRWCDTLQLRVDVTRYNFGLMWHVTILGWCDALQFFPFTITWNKLPVSVFRAKVWLSRTDCWRSAEKTCTKMCEVFWCYVTITGRKIYECNIVVPTVHGTACGLAYVKTHDIVLG